MQISKIDLPLSFFPHTRMPNRGINVWLKCGPVRSRAPAPLPWRPLAPRRLQPPRLPAGRTQRPTPPNKGPVWREGIRTRDRPAQTRATTSRRTSSRGRAAGIGSRRRVTPWTPGITPALLASPRKSLPRPTSRGSSRLSSRTNRWYVTRRETLIKARRL